MFKIAFFIVTLSLLIPCGLKANPVKTIKTLATHSQLQGIALLTKKGFRCESSGEIPITNWHCSKQEKKVSFNQSTLYLNCDALNLCHFDTNLALRSLFKGTPRAIKSFSIHDHRQSTRWHCLDPDRGVLKICLSSQNNRSQQDLPLFDQPDQLTARR